MDKIKKNDTALVLFVYNRYEHLKVTLGSLSKHGLNEYEVFIFCDGPKDEKDALKTESVRKLVRDFSEQHKNISIIESDVNSGLAPSVFKGLNEVFSKFEKAIILEDDILIRSGFLPFLTKGLRTFENEINVAGIAGYSYLEKEQKLNYFLPIGTSWGWATWRRVWKYVENNPSKYLEEIKSKNLKDKFDFGSFPFFRILEGTVEGTNSSWAIQFYASFFLRNQVFLFPNVSLCENIGFDGSGTHTGKENIKFNSRDMASSLNPKLPDKIAVNPKMSRQVERKLSKMAGINWKTISKQFLKKVLFYGRS